MYWERDEEITLLWTVLEALDSKTQGHQADMIVSSMIEMDVVNADRAPTALQAWQEEWDGYEVDRKFVAKHYTPMFGDSDDDDCD